MPVAEFDHAGMAEEAATFDVVKESGNAAGAAGASIGAVAGSLALPPILGPTLGAAIGYGIGKLIGKGLATRELGLGRSWIGFSSNEEIERVLGRASFNSLPTLESAFSDSATNDPIAALIAHPHSLYTEAYRSLATNLRMSGPEVKVIAVTSALPKEGKTTCAINMARTVAMGGERVLLVDCNLRRRNVSTLLAPGADKGLVQVVRGEARLEDVIHVDETGLHILPLAPLSHIGTQPFGTPAFDEIMATLRSEYDVIVLDTAPVLAVVDVRLLLTHIDALGILARWRQTPIRAIRSAIQQIEGSGGEIAGVALTMVTADMHSYDYNDGSRYYTHAMEYYHVA